MMLKHFESGEIITAKKLNAIVDLINAILTKKTLKFAFPVEEIEEEESGFPVPFACVPDPDNAGQVIVNGGLWWGDGIGMRLFRVFARQKVKIHGKRGESICFKVTAQKMLYSPHSEGYFAFTNEKILDVEIVSSEDIEENLGEDIDHHYVFAVEIARLSFDSEGKLETQQIVRDDIFFSPGGFLCG